MTTREVEWDEEQQGWMLALAEYRAEQERNRCPSCGGDQRNCCDPEADGTFTVPPPIRCHATTALSIAQDQYKDSPQPEALLWRVKRRR